MRGKDPVSGFGAGVLGGCRAVRWLTEAGLATRLAGSGASFIAWSAGTPRHHRRVSQGSPEMVWMDGQLRMLGLTYPSALTKSALGATLQNSVATKEGVVEHNKLVQVSLSL